MVNDKIEFDILANGTPAIKELNKVDNQLNKIDHTQDQVTKNMKVSWKAVGVTIAGVTAGMGLLAARGVAAEKMFVSLDIAVKSVRSNITGSTRDWRNYVTQVSEATGEQENIIAGLTATAINAGLANDQVNNVLQTAIGLGRAFPNESIEEFVNNMVMLNTTGEVQGFLVDVLEQRYKTTEIQLISTADKMAALTGIATEANEAYKDESIVKYSNLMNKFGRALDLIGVSIVKFLDNIGALDFVMNTFGDVVKKADNSTQGFDNTLKQTKNTLQDIKVLTEEAPEWVMGMQKAFDMFGQTVGQNGVYVSDFAKQVQDSTSKTIGTLENEMTNFITKGKADWKNFADSIINELARIAVRQAVLKPLVGAFGDIFGDLVLHSGKVGIHHAGMIPTHHNGSMRSDERMAKLQVGESVISRHGTSKNKSTLEAINRGESIQGSQEVINPNVNITIQALDTQSGVQFLLSNKGAIKSIITESIVSGTEVRKAIRSAG